MLWEICNMQMPYNCFSWEMYPNQIASIFGMRGRNIIFLPLWVNPWMQLLPNLSQLLIYEYDIADTSVLQKRSCDAAVIAGMWQCRIHVNCINIISSVNLMRTLHYRQSLRWRNMWTGLKISRVLILTQRKHNKIMCVFYGLHCTTGV